MVKVGDRVRFLNSVGGGIVKKINKDIALVEEEDGFETPVLLRECVVIEAGKKYSDPVPEKRTDSPQISRNIIQEEEEEAEDELPLLETPEGERLNILLAFVPEERKNLQITRFDAYLINDSNYFLDFTYSCKTDAGWLVRYHGSIEPNIKLHLETFGKEILNDLERICIQAIAYKKEKAFKQKNPISVEHRVDTVKFYKLHSFRENDYFDEDALIFPIVRNDIPERSFIIDPVEIETAIKQKKDSEKPERQAIKKKHRPINEPLEIDLHINELLETTAGMSNSDILQYQLQKVREILNEHKNKKGRKIIFIHGKGDGVLRNALITELKTKYKTFYYQDASFREYGYGATQVTIR